VGKQKPRSGSSKLGETVKRLRKKIGLSQTQLANDVGISQGYLSQIEVGEGNPTFTVFFALAKSLKIDPVALFKKAGPWRRHNPSGKEKIA
jgi:transcriptional regulator with XRE-family HTH domain